VLLADLMGERAGDFERVLASRGAQQGMLSGAALERHRRQLAEDRELLRVAEAEDHDDGPTAA